MKTSVKSFAVLLKIPGKGFAKKSVKSSAKNLMKIFIIAPIKNSLETSGNTVVENSDLPVLHIRQISWFIPTSLKIVFDSRYTLVCVQLQFYKIFPYFVSF